MTIPLTLLAHHVSLSVASLVFIQVYAVGLIYLFGQMYKNKYNKKKV